MKKSLRFLLPFALLSSVLLSSCGGEKIEKVDVPYGRLYDTSLSGSTKSFDIITHSKLASMVEESDSFVLLVYNKYSTCTCWQIFKQTITAYMKNTNAQIFTINYSELKNIVSEGQPYGLAYDETGTTETIAIFENGSLKTQRSRSGLEDPWANDLAVFTEWMEGRVSFTKSLYVNKAQLDALYAGKKAFTIMFSRESCGDCSYVNNHFLKDYNSKNNVEDFYIIDCDSTDIRPLKENGELDSEAWASFKDEYGLSVTNNPTFGYDQGFVPTFFHINPISGSTKSEMIDDGDVYFNDTVELVSSDLKITSSFFTEERLANLQFLTDAPSDLKTVLQGMAIPKENATTYDFEGNKYYFWNHSSAATYHDALLSIFLDTYIKTTAK